MKKKLSLFYVLLCLTLIATMLPAPASGQTLTVGRYAPAASKTIEFQNWKVAPAGTISDDSLGLA